MTRDRADHLANALNANFMGPHGPATDLLTDVSIIPHDVNGDLIYGTGWGVAWNADDHEWTVINALEPAEETEGGVTMMVASPKASPLWRNIKNAWRAVR